MISWHKTLPSFNLPLYLPLFFFFLHIHILLFIKKYVKSSGFFICERMQDIYRQEDNKFIIIKLNLNCEFFFMLIVLKKTLNNLLQIKGDLPWKWVKFVRNRLIWKFFYTKIINFNEFHSSLILFNHLNYVAEVICPFHCFPFNCFVFSIWIKHVSYHFLFISIILHTRMIRKLNYRYFDRHTTHLLRFIHNPKFEGTCLFTFHAPGIKSVSIHVTYLM